MAWQVIGSLLAVGAILGLVGWLGLGSNAPRLDIAEARAIAEDAYGGFAQAAVFLDESEGSALLESADGRLALVLPHGARFLARLIEPGTTALAKEGVLLVSPTGRGSTHRLLLGSDASAWAERIQSLS